MVRLWVKALKYYCSNFDESARAQSANITQDFRCFTSSRKMIFMKLQQTFVRCTSNPGYR